MDILLISDQQAINEGFTQLLENQDRLHLATDAAALSEQLGSVALASPLIDFCVLDCAAQCALAFAPTHMGQSTSPETLAQCLSRLNLTFGLPLVYIDDPQAVGVDTPLSQAGDDLLSKDACLAQFKQKRSVYGRWATRFRQFVSVRDELGRMSMLDAATQLPNHRGFNQELVKHWGQMKREHHALGLILLEIDGFERHQQTIGQALMDECTQTLALLLEGSLSRPLDTVFRLSAARFAIMLPNTNAQGATKVAQAVMRHITEAQISLTDSVIMQVSMSAVSFSPEQIVQNNTQAFTQFAEDVLETARAQGGNRIISGEQSARAAG